VPVRIDVMDVVAIRLASIRRRAIAYMTLFGVSWAVYLAIGTFLPRGYSIFEVLWGRYALHVLLTVLLIGPVQGMSLVRTNRPAMQLMRGLLMVITSVSAVFATSGMSLDGVRAVLWLAPPMVIALDRVVRGTPCRAPVWIACTVCWVGTILILKPSLGHDVRSVFWALLTAGSFAGYQLLTPSLRSDPATTSVFYSGLITLVPMSAIVPWVWRPLTGQAIIVYFGMGVAGWLSLLFLDKALHTMEPGAVAVFGYVHLVAQVLVSAILSGGTPGPLGVLGCILILAGSAMAPRHVASI
jgi:drug/metabolite transporter (DMT)-like permease